MVTFCDDDVDGDVEEVGWNSKGNEVRVIPLGLAAATIYEGTYHWYLLPLAPSSQTKKNTSQKTYQPSQKKPTNQKNLPAKHLLESLSPSFLKPDFWERLALA